MGILLTGRLTVSAGQAAALTLQPLLPQPIFATTNYKQLMPGYELWSDAERKELNDVLDTGILMRYGFEGPRKGKWKSRELEQEICRTFGAGYAQLTSSGTSALTTALTALGIG